MLRLTTLLLVASAVSVHAAPVTLNSFEDPGVLQTLETYKSTVALSDAHVTDGKQSLQIRFDAGDWPHVWFSLGKAYTVGDWRADGAFVFDAYNPEDKPLTLCVRIDDAATADGGQHCRQTGVDLPPKKQVKVAMAILPENQFMRGVPPNGGAQGDVNGSLGGNPINLKHIIAFQFFLAGPKQAHTVFIDNVRLVEGVALKGIVDRFGQCTGAEWPGKVHDEAELAQRRTKEAQELKKAPRPADRDQYGGWATGPKLAATGWFRTQKMNGKWWFVTPTGRLFWSVGLDCVGPDATGPIKGREDLFTWLPEKDDPLHAFGGKDTGQMNFWGLNLYRKYGPNWERPWLDMTRERMKVWGFNTIGNWSWDRSCRTLRLPFVVAIHPWAPGFPGGWNDIFDVYADEWAKSVDGTIKGATDNWRTDPYCIGYFVDNELSWGGWGPDDQHLLPVNALKLGGDRKVKQAFTDLLRRKYTDIARLNAAWGTGVASWDEFLAQPVNLPAKHNAALEDDLGMLLRDFAKRYFTTVKAAMTKYAPNQLYLGPRFAVAPDDVVTVAKDYCDVMSYNIYGRADAIRSRGEQVAKLDRPTLIGEFHFGALDRGMFHTGLGPVASQEERGIQYAEYIRTALAQPWCVGAHWFTYGDEALTGRFDGENYNIGFVNVTDTPYVELVRHATEINRKVYQIRGKGM